MTAALEWLGIGTELGSRGCNLEPREFDDAPAHGIEDFPPAITRRSPCSSVALPSMFANHAPVM
jgi:hypothetical protein